MKLEWEVEHGLSAADDELHHIVVVYWKMVLDLGTTVDVIQKEGSDWREVHSEVGILNSKLMFWEDLTDLPDPSGHPPKTHSDGQQLPRQTAYFLRRL